MMSLFKVNWIKFFTVTIICLMFIGLGYYYSFQHLFGAQVIWLSDGVNVSKGKSKDLEFTGSNIGKNDRIQYRNGRLALKTKGGIGNHMFQYASLLGIAERNHLFPVILDKMKLLSSVFHLHNYQPKKSKCKRINIGGQKAGIYNKKTETIKKKLVKKNKNCAFLHGYFQSYKYFSNIEGKLRKYFTFKKGVQQVAKQFLRGTEDFVRVGVHIRRGDYMKNKTRKYGFTVATKEYLTQAVNYFNKRYNKILYVVCSNDKQWSRDNFPVNNSLFSHYEDGGVDLAILSQCNHTIMTVGSFGWWAAWLVNGTTVYYKDWPKPGSKLSHLYNINDYFYPHWTPMS